MKKILLISVGLSLGFISLNSCRDADLEPTLEQSKDIETGIKTAEDLKAVNAGIYNYLSDYRYYGRDYIIFGEVRSDNAFANGNSNRFVSPAEFNMNADDAYASDTWSMIYNAVGNCNIVISKENAGLVGDPNQIKQYVGEAYALRALAHFDLVKLFGQQHVGTGGMSALGVPYVTTFKDQTKLFPARNTVQEVYDLAMADLDKAASLLDNQSRGRYYISKDAVYAIKARIALYFKKYDVARDAAEKVVTSQHYSIVNANSFSTTFSTKTSPNIIFSIANNAVDNQGINGLAQIYRPNEKGGGYADIIGLKNLKDVYTSTDVRGLPSMIDSFKGSSDEFYNKGKYPDNNAFADDVPLIRYEEVVLTYAEALLNTGNAAEALRWLNMVPANRNAAPYTVANMDNILMERRKELAFEGFRFYDLVRTGRAIPLVAPTKQRFKASIEYGNTKLAFPIPNSEVGVNSNVKQNQGY